MTEDPLEKHHGLIAVAERGQLEGHAHMVGLQCIADLAAALRAEREQVAELETDAKLGRMVREMPVYSLLCHESHWLGEWHAVWPGDNLHYNKQYGPTPEAALEAAQKGETPRAAKHTICLPQFEEGESWVSHAVPVSKLEIDEGEPKEDKP